MEISRYYKKALLKSGEYAIYNTLLMKMLFVNENELVQIEEMTLKDHDTIMQLLHIGIYVTDSSVDDRALVELQQNLEREFGTISVVYLILTNACNLRCTYCAVKNIADKSNKVSTDFMQKEDAHKFIVEYLKYVKVHKVSNPEFIFYGGEPFLHWELLTYFVETFESLNKDLIHARFSIVTNGTLLTDENILFCKKHHIGISLSVDGPRNITDKGRKSLQGYSVYSKIDKAFELMTTYEYISNLSITISQEVLKYQREMFDWLENITTLYKIREISYNLLHFQEKGFDREEYCKEATKFIIKSQHKFGDKINEDRVNRKLQSLLYSTFFYGDCAAVTGNQIVFKANGDISLCQAFCQSNESTVGNIKYAELSDIIANNVVSALSKYKSFLPVYRKECQKCEALFSCGGGCYWDINDVDKWCDTGFCQHSKIMHTWMLECMYNYVDEKYESGFNSELFADA